MDDANVVGMDPALGGHEPSPVVLRVYQPLTFLSPEKLVVLPIVVRLRQPLTFLSLKELDLPLIMLRVREAREEGRRRGGERWRSGQRERERETDTERDRERGEAEGRGAVGIGTEKGGEVGQWI